MVGFAVSVAGVPYFLNQNIGSAEKIRVLGEVISCYFFFACFFLCL
jgi:hypothetical protein